MAEPLMPHPEQPDTALDEHRDAPAREPHAEADETPTSAGRARKRRAHGGGPDQASTETS
ncbi:hypothetical protein [Amnibacterium sp.]|uniref:hypothetical protein n=1 Tax=Amnibacterium sp. TaxID=1872496 RepID=UPI002609A5FC|nr:hypothetical protein [Amnibacterium sp.]MCU1474256.1 hypothetical protein [Amnibacterium sp.]